MEKKYEKPQILFENIQMNTSIASCSYVLVGKNGGYIEPDQMDSYYDFGLIYTADEAVYCTAPTPICYHQPDDKEAFRVTNLS